MRSFQLLYGVAQFLAAHVNGSMNDLTHRPLFPPGPIKWGDAASLALRIVAGVLLVLGVWDNNQSAARMTGGSSTRTASGSR